MYLYGQQTTMEAPRTLIVIPQPDLSENFIQPRQAIVQFPFQGFSLQSNQTTAPETNKTTQTQKRTGIKELKCKNFLMQKELTKLKKNLASSKQNLIRLQTRHIALSKMINKIPVLEENITEIANGMPVLRYQMLKAQEQIEATRNDIIAIRGEVHTMMSSFPLLKREMQALKEEITRLQQTYYILYGEYFRTTEAMVGLKNQTEINNQITQKKLTLLAAETAKSQNTQKYEAEIKSMKAEITEIYSNMMKMMNDSLSLMNDNKQIIEANSKIKKDNYKLKKEVAELEKRIQLLEISGRHK